MYKIKDKQASRISGKGVLHHGVLPYDYILLTFIQLPLNAGLMFKIKVTDTVGYLAQRFKA